MQLNIYHNIKKKDKGDRLMQGYLEVKKWMKDNNVKLTKFNKEEFRKELNL